MLVSIETQFQQIPKEHRLLLTQSMTHASSSTDFTRGWELLAHFLKMLKASLLRHVLASSLFGLVAGTAWFQTFLRTEPANIIRYAVVELKGQESPRLQAAFDGRPFPFLLRQWSCRVVASGMTAFLLGAVFIIHHGGSLRRRKRLRGVELKDAITAGGLLDRRTPELLVVAATVALNVAVHLILSAPDVAAIPNYATAWLATAAPPFAAHLSPDGTGAAIWFDGPRFFGFHAAPLVESTLHESFGVSFPGLVLRFLAQLVATSVLAIYALQVVRGTGVFTRPDTEWQLAGVPIPDSKACYHFLFCGSPGSGKSTAIKDMLDQIRARGRRAIVYDLSGEYVELFYREGTDLILNPLDARTELWTPWAEVTTDADYTMLARSLFPPGGTEPFWADAGATLFASTMKALHENDQTTNEELYKRLTHGALEDLHDFLEGTQAARLLDPKAGAMPSNLIATVTSRLAAWESLPDPAREDTAFSIRDFVHQPGGDAWLFLSANEDQRPLLKPLLSLWSDIAATAILTLDKSNESRIWFVLDEVASLQKLPALPGLLERGRKHGCAALLGLQAMPQLEDAYGNKLARAIASQPQTWLVLRSVEPETARFLESALGQTEYVESQASYSMGAHAYRDGVSLQERIATRPVALASEISSLPDLTGFLKLPGGHEVYRVAYRHRPRPAIAPPFIGRGSC